MAKYDPLLEHLCSAPAEPVEMTFTQVAQLVGGLPASARKHQAWLSNEQDGRHVEAVLPDGRIQTIEGNKDDQVTGTVRDRAELIGFVRLG